MADRITIEDKQDMVFAMATVIERHPWRSMSPLGIAQELAEAFDTEYTNPMGFDELFELRSLRRHHEMCTSNEWVPASVRDSLVQQNNALSRRLRRLKESVLKEIMFEERGD